MRLTAVLAIAATAVPVAARAAQYEIFIAVEDEEDLYELLTDGEISEDTFNTLLGLLRRGLDLNTASREELYSLPNLTYAEVDAIIAYREGAGRIDDPAALVAAGALSPEKLLAIAPFLIIRAPDKRRLVADGFVRGAGLYTAGADDPPPGYLQVRASSWSNVTVGVAGVVTHHRLGEVSYDPFRLGLAAEGPAARVHVPKVYVWWENDDVAVIAGTYRIGFGQRLTFDSTDQYTPNGFQRDETIERSTDMTRACRLSTGELDSSPCAGDKQYEYTTPDFSWREAQRGLAIGAKKLATGGGSWLQAYSFFSYQNRSIYQYQLYDRGQCLDPRSEEDGCGAPPVFEAQDDVGAQAPGLSFFTLPGAYREILGGANLSWFHDRRTHVGVTGYGARVDWNVDGIDLDFQEWSPYPFGGPFGAIGLDGAVGAGRADLAFEVARSFDSMPEGNGAGGGGFAGIARATATFRRSELEASFRWYDRAFANPYAGPISAPDTEEGNRARDEAGVRVRYSGLVQKVLRLRASADVWVEPSENIPKLDLRWRSDFDQSNLLRWGIGLEYKNNSLTAACEDDSGAFLDDDYVTCADSQVRILGRVRWQPMRKLTVGALYQHELIDERAGDADAGDPLRQDSSFVLEANGWATPDLRLRTRYRFLFDDISDAGSLEQSHRWSMDVLYRKLEGYRLRARYDLVWFTDDRASTAARTPNPQHWLLLQAEAQF